MSSLRPRDGGRAGILLPVRIRHGQAPRQPQYRGHHSGAVCPGPDGPRAQARPHRGGHRPPPPDHSAAAAVGLYAHGGLDALRGRAHLAGAQPGEGARHRRELQLHHRFRRWRKMKCFT